jgi:NitT/TauT family transport system permease protein
VTLAFVGSVVAETVASNRGIGNMMMVASSTFNVPLVFAGLVALGVLGVIIYAAMAILERRTTGWAQRSNFAT